MLENNMNKHTTLMLAGFITGALGLTNQAYADFLTAVARDDPDKARSHAPRSGPNGSIIWFDYDENTRTFRVPEKDHDGDPWDPQWPITLVSYYDAVAYCEWRSLLVRFPPNVRLLCRSTFDRGFA